MRFRIFLYFLLSLILEQKKKKIYKCRKINLNVVRDDSYLDDDLYTLFEDGIDTYTKIGVVFGCINTYFINTRYVYK